MTRRTHQIQEHEDLHLLVLRGLVWLDAVLAAVIPVSGVPGIVTAAIAVCVAVALSHGLAMTPFGFSTRSLPVTLVMKRCRRCDTRADQLIPIRRAQSRWSRSIQALWGFSAAI